MSRAAFGASRVCRRITCAYADGANAALKLLQTKQAPNCSSASRSSFLRCRAAFSINQANRSIVSSHGVSIHQF